MLRVIAIAFGLLVSPSRAVELDAAWFRSNYLPAAAKLQKAYSECTADVTEIVSSDKSKDYNEATYHFAYDGNRRKFDRTIVSHNGESSYERSRTIVASPEVSFSVFTKQGKNPLLQRVNRSALGFAQARESIDRDACDSIYAPFALFEQPFAQHLVDKDFEIIGVKRDNDRVRLEFALKKQDWVANGWIAFLPDRLWAIDSWDISQQTVRPTPGFSYRTVSELSYGDQGQVPALREWTRKTYHPDRIETDNLVVNNLAFAPAAAREFKLSSYGYDDRIAMPPSVGKSLWFWLAIAGITCLVGAFVLRTLIARRAAV